MYEVITTVLFANGLALFFMIMCGSNKNCISRTESELELLKNDSKDKN